MNAIALWLAKYHLTRAQDIGVTTAELLVEMDSFVQVNNVDEFYRVVNLFNRLLDKRDRHITKSNRYLDRLAKRS